MKQYYEQNKLLIIDKFGNDFHEASNYNLAYKCPFCLEKRGKEDNDYKLYVSFKNLGFFCFKCHSHGYLKRVDTSEFTNVYNNLYNMFNNHISNEETESDDFMFYIGKTKPESGSYAYKYCLDRGITEDLIDYYGIRVGNNDLYGRIIIPNKVYNNQWTDIYSARSFLDKNPKYVMPFDVKKSKIVFNLHRIKDGVKNLFINEGVITSINAGKDSIALYGCHPSYEQISQIVSKNAENYYCTLDNDEAGRKGNLLLARLLSKYTNKNIYVCFLPEGKDASDLGYNEYRKYVISNSVLYDSGLNKLYSYCC